MSKRWDPVDNRWQDLEAIRTVKAQYFRFLDTRQWDRWGALFTDDAVMYTESQVTDARIGREMIVSKVRDRLEHVTTIHHGFLPEIWFESDDEAVGIWAMEDRLLTTTGPEAGSTVHGFGHYRDRYARDDGAWRIREVRITRLHVELSSRRILSGTQFAGAVPFPVSLSSIDADFGA
jgi:hypothetical protein